MPVRPLRRQATMAVADARRPLVDARVPRSAGAVIATAALVLPALLGVTATQAAASQPRLDRLVLRATPGALAGVEAGVRSLGGTVGREMPALDTAAVTLSPLAAAAMRRDPRVASLTDNAAVRLDSRPTGYAPMADSYSLVRAEAAASVRSSWNDGAGKGIDVALVDSGVVPVDGLADAGKVINGPDLTPESQSADTRFLDTFGHGTHMAGIIAGRDTGAKVEAGNNADFLGVAPKARIVSVKVADARGNTDVSLVIAGIDWVVQHAHDPGMNIRVLNLSFGTDASQPYVADPLAYAAEVAWRAGIVVVVSAGNGGSKLGRLDNPAQDPHVIAVGAADAVGNKVSSFSSVGDGVRNPDLVAPGAHVQSLRVPGSYIDATHGATGKIDNRFFRGSGTSQAAAFTSGAVADLLSLRPGLSPNQVKAALTSTAVPLPDGSSPEAQGHGLINLSAAVARTEHRGEGGNGPSQPFPASAGTGTLEGARGSAHQVLAGVTLAGERDIMGRPFDSAAMAAAELAGNAWAGGVWNGSAWAGSSWAGSSWAGSAWAGSAWASGAWTGSGWAGSSWLGSGWAGSSWAGSSWLDATWGGGYSAYAASRTGVPPGQCAAAGRHGPGACAAQQAEKAGFGQDDWK
ncbi:MAG: hypothetical protein NVSMB13_12290 [Mycobacteriales bacterium]